MKVYQLSYATSYFPSGKYELYVVAETAEEAVKAGADFLGEECPDGQYDLSWLIALSGKVIVAEQENRKVSELLGDPDQRMPGTGS
jgi:hypothetical protein